MYETDYILHNVHIMLFVSETSLFMLNLVHLLSHCKLPYIAIDCVNKFSFQHFKFFVLFLNFTEICVICCHLSVVNVKVDNKC